MFRNEIYRWKIKELVTDSLLRASAAGPKRS